MRRFFSLIICTVLCILFLLPSFAYNAPEIQEKILSENKEELDSVYTTLMTNNQNPDNRQINTESLNILHSFRLFYLNSGDIISAYEKSGKFGSNITDKYCWVVPYSDDSGEVVVVRSDNTQTGWAVKIVSSFNADTVKNFNNVAPGIINAYNVIIDKYPDFDVKSIRFCECNQLKCRLMYFTAEGKEYIIPYFTAPVNNFTTAKVYTVSDFMDAARRYVAENENSLKPEDEKYDKIFIVYIVAGTLLVFALVVFFIYRHRSAQKEENVARENPDNPEIK